MRVAELVQVCHNEQEEHRMSQHSVVVVRGCCALSSPAQRISAGPGCRIPRIAHLCQKTLA